MPEVKQFLFVSWPVEMVSIEFHWLNNDLLLTCLIPLGEVVLDMRVKVGDHLHIQHQQGSNGYQVCLIHIPGLPPTPGYPLLTLPTQCT